MTAPELPFYPITHDDGLGIVDALNDIADTQNSPSLIAEDFDETKNYVIGDYVIYSACLYRFVAPHSAGAWNSGHTTQVRVGEELGEKASNSIVAPAFRSDWNYDVDDVVTYQGGLYRFITAHSAGDWNRSQVVTTNAISEGGGGGGGGGGGAGIGDVVTFDEHTMIVTSSERTLEPLESSIAIVANGDTHIAIDSGQYVYVKNHGALDEGLYIANSDIDEDEELTASNLTKDTEGGLNSVKNSIDSDVAGINSSLSAIDNSLAIVSDGDTHAAISSGQYVYVKNHGTLAEGLYTANSAIGANVALTSSNLTNVHNNKGGFNSLIEKINNLFAFSSTQFVARNIGAGVNVEISSQTISKSGYKALFFSVVPSYWGDMCGWSWPEITISGNNVVTGKGIIHNSQTWTIEQAYFFIKVLWMKL